MASAAEPGAAGGQRNAQAASLGALANLCLNEDEARVLLRLQGGLRKLQPLLFAADALLQTKCANAIYNCAPNAETKVSMRILDILRPLVLLLASPSADARVMSFVSSASFAASTDFRGRIMAAPPGRSSQPGRRNVVTSSLREK